MISANKTIDFWIYFNQRECWNCGIIGPEHGNPIQSTKCQLTRGFVVSLNLDWISTLILQYIDKKLRVKKQGLVITCVLWYYYGFLSNMKKKMQSKMQAYPLSNMWLISN